MKKIEYKILREYNNRYEIRFTYVAPELIHSKSESDPANIIYADNNNNRIISFHYPFLDENEKDINNIVFIWGMDNLQNNNTIKVYKWTLDLIDEYNSQFEDSFFNNKEEIENSKIMY